MLVLEQTAYTPFGLQLPPVDVEARRGFRGGVRGPHSWSPAQQCDTLRSWGSGTEVEQPSNEAFWVAPPMSRSTFPAAPSAKYAPQPEAPRVAPPASPTSFPGALPALYGSEPRVIGTDLDGTVMAPQVAPPASSIPFPGALSAKYGSEPRAVGAELDSTVMAFRPVLPAFPITAFGNSSAGDVPEPQAVGDTTAMVLNIPSRLSMQAFVDKVNETRFKGLFNFCNIPRSLPTGRNLGFAFVNFETSEQAWCFMQEWAGMDVFHCGKRLKTKPAKIQGLQANIDLAQKTMKRKNTAFKPLLVL